MDLLHWAMLHPMQAFGYWIVIDVAFIMALLRPRQRAGRSTRRSSQDIH